MKREVLVGYARVSMVLHPQYTASAPSFDGCGRVAFSTRGVPDDRRIEFWEGHNATALIGLRCRRSDPSPFEAAEVNVQLPRLQLARVVGSAHLVERGPDVVRRQPAEAIALYFTLSRRSWFRDDRGTWTLRPGDLLMCDADRPFARGFADGVDELVLRVPRAVFSEVVGVDEMPRASVTRFAKPCAALAHALAAQIVRTARSPQPGAADERTLLALLGAVATGGRGAAMAAHRAAAEQLIECSLNDRRLSAAQVAAGVGISERHLSRVFAQAGTTVPRYILGRRLDVAHGMLRDARHASLTIAEVAVRCGFGSPARFSNAFVQRFGVRASELRRETAAR
jgi:AraC-like DNA-binding protein